MKLYVDMDGVLADFDTHHANTFGVKSSVHNDVVDWKKIEKIKDYYLHIPPMPDLGELWAFLEPLSPTVLTGIPSTIGEAAANKRAWVNKHLGPYVPVICCPSKEKCLHAKPGDILIDDWEKYKQLWVAKGGRWITHTSAENTIKELRRML